jgi:hypothetical protein
MDPRNPVNSFEAHASEFSVGPILGNLVGLSSLHNPPTLPKMLGICREEHALKLKELSQLSEIKAGLEMEVEGLKESSEQLAIARDQLTADLATVNAALNACEAARDTAQVEILTLQAAMFTVMIWSCRVETS